ncbi:induced myeloid leukemia cell differentiation protein Mcl-1 [Coregonus clupeaformis]|uniref:induced myeloid leukemia cell differentiation protein Mcl-1 n=1 Tax=Coregonus clupeaformis TaxID=59861 RepID=UPI001E1C97C1|nr:induced myeloid leukemia cell differentiation protein Mcl-1 [Coregonus clupeaformis]
MNLSKSFTRATTTMLNIQNGVVGGSSYPAGASPLYYFGANGAVCAGASPKSKVDTDLGNGTGDTPPRPTKLGVNVVKSNVLDNHLSDRSNNDDSDDSLPCTPQMASECGPEISNCPSGDEVLEHDTRQLIENVLGDYTGLSPSRWKQSKTLTTMKRVVEDVIAKHRYAYNGMIDKLDLDDRNDDMSVIKSVAKTLFSDGITNWGRIASLVAFGAVVSHHLKERGRGHCVELVGQEIATYLLSDQRDWLVKNNAWNGFVEFFHVQDPESSVRNTLIAFAGVAGIGATLAMLIR